jgi:predicted lipoprotein
MTALRDDGSASHIRLIADVSMRSCITTIYRSTIFKRTIMMKKLTAFLILCLPLVAAMAQQPGEMDEAQMQQMMQQMESMQNCMQNIDQAEMQAFQERAQKMNEEVKALCAAGKRDEAVATAMEFGKEAASNKAMQEMKKCGEGMQQMMPKIVEQTQNDNSSNKHHICDTIND